MADPVVEPVAPVFDAAAFQAALMAEVNKTLNGAIKTLKTDITKLIPQPVTPEPVIPDPGVTPNPDPAAQTRLAAEKREKEELLARIAAMETANKEAQARTEASDRRSLLSQALSLHQLNGENAIDMAMQALEKQMKKGDDGNYYIGDQSVKDGVPNFLKANEYLLKPVPVSGSGAGRTNGTSSKPVDIESIGPGMSADQKAAAWAEIRAAMPQ